ncbi:hydroxyethylthiazole kinase [candidate division KSB1 bacterium]|nr:hydroxyethylthiazole kinase [candidate division KSB1 bacterium]RQW01505.1 MAG: hydroxyethylthiazole kinase [candidate division KSB1 bacterium]
MIDAKKIWQDVQAIRKKAPLVHNITNYVVMNTTANALLCIGASPVMAHALEEVEEMVGMAAALGGALVINIGTLSQKWIESMAVAMRAAQKRSVPIVFDPVGAGATTLRTQVCHQLLGEVSPTILRGNASEIMALLDATVQTRGVDSSRASSRAKEAAATAATLYRCVVCVSGEEDIITDGKTVRTVRNGHAMMSRVTGLGCTATALIGAFAAVNAHPLDAAAHGMAVMGIAGEIAAAKAQGPGTLQLHFYDALYRLSAQDIEKRLR